MNTTLVMARETMALNTIKLNYVIPESLDEALTRYCEQTGRSASDVIRQLLSEYIDGERELSTPARDTSNGIRSNMMLPGKILEALDQKILTTGHGTRGGVIARLLCDFLENRLGSIFSETITVNVERSLYNKLYEKGQKLGKPVEEVILDACRTFA
jgi:metal-responsive CopG/Arc/MetJ family transcriptional regulator